MSTGQIYHLTSLQMTKNMLHRQKQRHRIQERERSALPRRFFPEQGPQARVIRNGLCQCRLEILMGLVIKLEQPLVQQHVFRLATGHIQNERGAVLMQEPLPPGSTEHAGGALPAY